MPTNDEPMMVLEDNVLRPMTADEIKQRKVDQETAKAEAAEAETKKAQQAAITAAAVAHAKSLGFTDEMIRVMYPTLVEE